MKKLILSFAVLCLPMLAFAKSHYQISEPVRLLLKEDFGSPRFPDLFTVGVGDWAIIDGTLRGRQQPADKHTAFRKIFLDHGDVIYEYDMKLEGEGFTRLMINWDLVHVSKGEIHLDKAQVFKIKEKNKRAQMAAQNRDQGLDPLKGNYEEKTHPVNEAPLQLKRGQWYHVILESVGDKLCLQIDGQTVVGQHLGFTEKKDNFGFQAGGFETKVFIDNVRVFEAIAK